MEKREWRSEWCVTSDWEGKERRRLEMEEEISDSVTDSLVFERWIIHQRVFSSANANYSWIMVLQKRKIV
jgi:hypothetical protein